MPTEEPSGPSAFYREDLADLAEYEFRIAQQSCTDCTEYHALWGYGRLAGINNGVEPDADILAPLVTGLTGPRARILIAGSAGAGVLALAAGATHLATPRFTVADRCPTPLAVCRRYAQSRGLTIETIQSDLVSTGLGGPYDVILAHNLLSFIGESVRTEMLRNFGRSLAETGSLVLVNLMLPPRRDGQGRLLSRDPSMLLDALAARGIPLPQDEATFRRFAEILAGQWRGRRTPLDPEQIEKNVVAAGFDIRERREHFRRRSISSGEEESRAIPTCFYVAARTQ